MQYLTVNNVVAAVALVYFVFVMIGISRKWHELHGDEKKK